MPFRRYLPYWGSCIQSHYYISFELSFLCRLCYVIFVLSSLQCLLCFVFFAVSSLFCLLCFVFFAGPSLFCILCCVFFARDNNNTWLLHVGMFPFYVSDYLSRSGVQVICKWQMANVNKYVAKYCLDEKSLQLEDLRCGFNLGSHLDKYAP